MTKGNTPAVQVQDDGQFVIPSLTWNLIQDDGQFVTVHQKRKKPRKIAFSRVSTEYF